MAFPLQPCCATRCADSASCGPSLQTKSLAANQKNLSYSTLLQSGDTALHVSALKSDDVATTKYLLEIGSSVHAVNDVRRTSGLFRIAAC